MYRLAIFLFLFASMAVNAQSRKPAPKNTKPVAVKDTVSADTVVAAAEELPKEFMVYSKKPKTKEEKMKLCLNLVSGDSVLNYCVNDSLCKDPEVAKIIFEEKNGDSTFVLVHVQAFSKPLDKPSCDAGKEVKLFFVRWNTKTNKAIVKQKSIESCMRAITNMTKEPISNWDGTSVLTLNYHRGGQNYVEVKFDPKQYKLGFQSSDTSESK
jgi:hypothetical protein